MIFHTFLGSYPLIKWLKISHYAESSDTIQPCLFTDKDNKEHLIGVSTGLHTCMNQGERVMRVTSV